jgi:hypothetical protein
MQIKRISEFLDLFQASQIFFNMADMAFRSKPTGAVQENNCRPEEK